MVPIMLNLFHRIVRILYCSGVIKFEQEQLTPIRAGTKYARPHHRHSLNKVLYNAHLLPPEIFSFIIFLCCTLIKALFTSPFGNPSKS